MRILFVVQRYGREIAGGAEQACRSIATGLVARGHAIEVLTSRAQSYIDWADAYPAGVEELDGVRVRRLSVSAPRDTARFNALHDRVTRHRCSLLVEEQWMDAQGPVLPELRDELAALSPSFDAVVFFNYLYWTTWAGLPVGSAHAPAVLVPAAHDEPTLDLSIFRLSLPLAHGLVFFTDEEAALLETRFRLHRPSVVAGLGVELRDGDPERGRNSLGIGRDPYLLYVGRIDPNKGVGELFDWFSAVKARRSTPLRLVLAGAPLHPLPSHPDVIPLGFVDEQTRLDLVAGCIALAQPSHLESFSLVMAEAWSQSKPVLAQARSPVVAGQVRRSNGGLLYRGFAEFEAGVDLLLDRPDVGARLGERGRDYVARELTWPAVLDRFEDFLSEMASHGPRRLIA